MKNNALVRYVGRSIFLRVFISNVVSFTLAYSGFLRFSSGRAIDHFYVTVIMLSVFFITIIFMYLSLMRYLKFNFIKPILSLRKADDESVIQRSHIKMVDFRDIVNDDLQKVASFRNQLGKTLKAAHLKTPLEEIHTEINKLTDGIIAALEQANLYNDDDTGSHMQRLGMYSRLIGKKYGLPDEFVFEIARYAPLHDVGKIGIPDDILKKPGRLTAQEWAIMKTHSKIGYDILKSVGLNPIAQNIALFHHERWVGTGYPEGLKGEEIPIEARLVAIADVFDALVNERVYKPSFPRDKVEKIMLSEIGRHFDPDLGKIAYESLDDLYAIFHRNIEEESKEQSLGAMNR